MALQTPPSWLQAGTYTAEQDRLIQQAIYSTSGYVGSGALAITAQASPNMTVNVAAGYGVIVGNGSPNLGAYVCYNNAITILNISTADPTLARIDRVVMTVNDAAYSGSTNNVVFTVVAGTPAASPAAPATPSNSISLATIAVAAATTTITSGNITDTRTAATSTLINHAALPITGGTMQGNVTLFAGTTSSPPLKLTSGSLLTSGTIGGAIEYDGKVPYFAPNSAATLTASGGRSVLAARHYYNVTSRNLTTASTVPQNIFGVSLSLAANTTYEIEIVGSTTITTSAGNTFTFQFTGTSGFTGWHLTGIDAVTPLTKFFTGTNPASAVMYTSGSAIAGSTFNFIIKGWVKVTTATTLVPNITATNTTTTSWSIPNAFIKATPVGSDTVTGVGAWA